MKPNIIFILLDGSRFDRINKSPEFSELLKEGTLLNNVSTAIPYTFGSINVLLTGQFGKENGVDGYYKVNNLKNDVQFLPEILQQNGYFTSRGLINDQILSSRGFNIRKEFDEYNTNLNVAHPELIKDTLSAANGKPFFTFLQFTRIHTVTVTEVLKKFEWNDESFYNNKEENMKLYDETFEEAGVYAKEIFETIKNLGILENSIIIFFADHGTGIGERFGERNYGSFTFEETIRTFYHFIGKDMQKGIVSQSLQSTIDIFPTILELCNIEYDKKILGKSFFSFLNGNCKNLENRKYTFSETGALHGPFPSPEISNVFCIKSPSHKIIYLKDSDEWEFYDLEKDPHELKNIIGSNTVIEKNLKKKLLEWVNR